MKDDLERETSVETSPKFQPKFQALSFRCETSLPYRFHSPRSCRAAVFLIQTNVSLWHGIVFQEPNPTSDCSCKLIQKMLKRLHTMRSFSVARKNSIFGRIPTRPDATSRRANTRGNSRTGTAGAHEGCMDWHVTHNCQISRLHFLSGERNPSELDLDHFSLRPMHSALAPRRPDII